MKKNALNDLKTKASNELKTTLDASYNDLTNLKIAVFMKKQKNTRVLKNKKLEIAKIKTILREKELEGKNV